MLIPKKKYFLLGYILSVSLINQAFTSNAKNSAFYVINNNKHIDLIEYIEEGKQYINTFSTQTNAILVLGLSGTGKSTLINYLVDMPLICIKKDRKWVIDVDNTTNVEINSLAIGHTSSSKTIYPSSVTPKNKDFSFLDTPGLDDTRGIGYEIANSVFRKEIAKNVTHLKFLILVTHQDLNNRGHDFRKSLAYFSSLFKSLENMSKSIAFIISRVDNENYSDDEILSMQKEVLIEINEEERTQNKMSSNEYDVYKQIVVDDRFEIFSNPKKAMRLSSIQKDRIIKLISKLDYVHKSDSAMSIRISSDYFEQLHRYSLNNYKKFTAHFDQLLSARNL